MQQFSFGRQPAGKAIFRVPVTETAGLPGPARVAEGATGAKAAGTKAGEAELGVLPNWNSAIFIRAPRMPRSSAT